MRLLAGILIIVLLAGCVGRPSPIPATPAGVAYAWASFDENGLRRKGASGVADRGTGRVLTIDDPVRVASISKLVVALGVMRLVEQGRLDLDADVSDRLGWPLRNPTFPDREISLRMLLSHTSSLRDEVDYVVPLGTDLRGTLADPAGFDPQHAPGAYFRYSNLNFPVIASMMEKATGERFDRLMERLVLKPLGLDACFNWTTCSDVALGRAVVLYGEDGSAIRDDLHGRLPDCPVAQVEGGKCDLEAYRLGTNGAIFSPQGGLRVSVRDLSVIGRLLLNEGRHEGAVFLNPASIESQLTPVWKYDGSNGETDKGFYCAYGLASQTLPVRMDGCHDDLFGDGRSVTGHAGDAYGVRSGLWIDRERKIGIAYFAAGNGSEPPRGRSAYRAIEEWLASKLR
ncbi:MAG: beta-lactamase family protein [Sphingosinicella sp.]|nr:beta-lactamase family protein [Sphingosinicella sp.]